MKLKVTRKEVYGVAKIYPACRNSKLIAELAGTKTLTESAIHTCIKLGYEFEQVQRPLLESYHA